MPVSIAASKSAEVADAPVPDVSIIPVAYRVAERFGMPVVILLAVLYWARTDVVQPLLDAHFGFVNKIVEGQEKHAAEVREVGKKLDRLIEISAKQ